MTDCGVGLSLIFLHLIEGDECGATDVVGLEEVDALLGSIHGLDENVFQLRAGSGDGHVPALVYRSQIALQRHREKVCKGSA